MKLTERLGTALPLIQAPMAGMQGSAMALAVCSAGALGSLPAGMLSAAALHAELTALSGGTQRPYNVNFFCHTTPAASAQADARWAQVLAPYYAELGLTQPPPAPPSRRPFDAEALAVLQAFKPAVVSFHFGLPEPDLLQAVKAWGATVLSSATTVDEAVWLQAHGADVIVAQGLEAGGHRGHFLSDNLSLQMGTLALLPQVLSAVRVPVLASGGIADARGVAAAMALGAAGVQVGTSYLLCDEASTSALHRAALQSPAAQHTALTNVFSGRAARGIVNRLMRELGELHPAAPAYPLVTATIAALKTSAEQMGCTDFSSLWAGQNTRGCQAIGAAALTRQLAQGFQ